MRGVCVCVCVPCGFEVVRELGVCARCVCVCVCTAQGQAREEAVIVRPARLIPLRRPN